MNNDIIFNAEKRESNNKAAQYCKKVIDKSIKNVEEKCKGKVMLVVSKFESKIFKSRPLFLKE